MTVEELYHQVAVDCVRYLGCSSLAQVDRMTLPEYRLLMEGVRLREVDRDYRCHLLAWLSQRAKATKKSGKNKRKPVYQKFQDFYDYREAQEKALEGETSGSGKKKNRFARLISHMRGEENHAGKL